MTIQRKMLRTNAKSQAVILSFTNSSNHANLRLSMAVSYQIIIDNATDRTMCCGGTGTFPITTLLCPALNYARYLLKGGVIRRAIAQSIIAAHLDATIHDEHERTRQRIEKTHGLVQNVLSTLGTILSSITTAARQIIKAINTRNIDGLDITGPRTPECRDQVLAVVVFLANPKHPQSIHHACDRTFRPIKGGYEDAERLYRWCHRNESRIWAWVETYRLNHDIE